MQTLQEGLVTTRRQVKETRSVVNFLVLLRHDPPLPPFEASSCCCVLAVRRSVFTHPNRQRPPPVRRVLPFIVTKQERLRTPTLGHYGEGEGTLAVGGKKKREGGVYFGRGGKWAG